MATWHQLQNPVPLFHHTDWTVVIDPPHNTRALMRFSTRALAEKYMRDLRFNNPAAATYAYILRPIPQKVKDWKWIAPRKVRDGAW